MFVGRSGGKYYGCIKAMKIRLILLAAVIVMGLLGCSVDDDESRGTIAAIPSIVDVCSDEGLGSSTIRWAVSARSVDQVRIEIAQGGDGATKVFYVGPGSGEMQTGNWVRPGMVFILVDGKTGAVLDTVEIQGKSC